MAEVVDLSGQRVEVQKEDRGFRQRGVELSLGDIAEQNERGEVRSLVAMVVDYRGRVHTHLSREFEDDVALLGALEVFKSDLLAKLRERREFENQEVPEPTEE